MQNTKLNVEFLTFGSVVTRMESGNVRLQRDSYKTDIASRAQRLVSSIGASGSRSGS